MGCAVLLLGVAAASPAVRRDLAEAARRAASGARAALASREQASETTALPAMSVCALQLGVYDNGERAQQETQRLSQAGVPCVVWQGERMRIVCAAALDAQTLSDAAPEGMDTYVIGERLPEVRLRLSGTRGEVERAKALLALPDALLTSLCSGGTVDEAVARARAEGVADGIGEEGAKLCGQLAQSLSDWCALMDRMRDMQDERARSRYAALTMCTLCRELRAQLLG